MPGATVVPACPPGAENIPRACAEEGVNCSSDYLTSEDLHGCCDGLACKKNASQVWTCATATPEEEALNWQCWDPLLPLTVSGPLESSQGALAYEHAELSLLERNEEGCITGLRLVLTPSEQSSLCRLELVAGPQTDAQGRLVITNGNAGTECPTLPLASGVYFADGELGTVAFEGYACEFCSAGTLSFELNGTLSGTASTPLTFAGAQFQLQGRFCETRRVTAPCPAVP
jgi:hypothetical protein